MNQEIFERVATEMTQIFAIQRDALDPHINLFELGLDSLMLLKLGQRLEGIYGVTVEMGYFFRELNTLEKIIGFVEQNARPASAPTAASAAPAQTGVDAAVQTTSDAQATTIPAPAGINLNGLFAQQIDTMLAVFRQQMSALIPSAASASVPAVSAAGATTASGAFLPSVPANPSPVPAAGAAGVAATVPAPHGKRLTAEEEATIRSIQRNVRGLKLDADTFTPAQEGFIRALLERHVKRTHGSRDRMRECRAVLADWKSTLSFRLSLKDAAYPIISAGSAGGHFRDVDGNDLIDIALGMGVHFPGHRNPVLLDAVQKQLAEGYELGPQCDLTGDAARVISRLTGCERVAFSNTGSEAVMMALRLARAHTGRQKIVLFSGSYHGIFDGVVAMRHGEEEAVTLSPGIPQGMVDDLLILDYGTEDSLRRIAQLSAEGNLAGVLVEPVQSRRPSLQPQTYLRKLRRITREHGVVLIFDEMVNGFRIAPGGAQAHFGIRADLAIYGKIIGGGMPVGVVAGNAAILDHIDGGAWDYGDDSVPGAEMIVFGGTFCRHPLAMASVCAVGRWFEENGTTLHDRTNRRTEDLADRLNLWFQQEEVPLRMSWFGSQFKFDTYGRYSPLLQPVELDLLYLLMLEKGVYTWERRTCFLSALHTDEDVAAIERAVRESVRELRAGGFEFKGGGPVLFRQLSSVERRLLAEMERGGRQDAYHMPGAWLVDGMLDADRLEIALGTVIKRHDTLRTSYRMVSGEYVARTDEEPAFFLERIAYDGRTPQQIVRDFQRPFELTRAPLFRAGLAQLADGGSLLLIDGLHLVLDGISLATLVQDLQAAYEERELQPLPASYAEYVHTMQAFTGSAQETQLLGAWKTYLSDAPEPVIPADYTAGAQLQAAVGHVRLEMDEATTAALRELGKSAGVSLFMLLSGGYASLLHTLSGQTDVVIGTVAAGRPGSRFSETVGMFVNTIALRLRLTPGETVRQYLSAVREACTFAYGHQELPFETLAAQGLGQLIRTMITYENADGRELQLSGCAMTEVTADIAGSMFPLSLDVIETGGVLHLDFEYDPGLLGQATVERWGNWFCGILKGFLAGPDRPREDQRPFAESEATAALRFGQGAPRDIPQSSLWQTFERQAERTPDTLAVVAPDGSRSYRQLRDLADRIAAHLKAQAPCAGKPVAVCFERSYWFPAAVFGILKAGGHYIPLAPDTPPARARTILQSAQAVSVLTSRALAAQCSGWGIPALAVEELPQIATTPAATSATAGGELAYVLFTSGSTGTPKGVMIPQRAVLNLAGWLQHEIYTPLGGAIQEGMLAHFVFDVSVQHLFGALLNGNTLHILAEHLAADGPSLRRYTQEQKLDLLDMTPSQFLILTGGGERTDFAPVRHLNFGAEALPRSVVQAFFRNPRNRGVRVCNMYGPTETCVQSTWAEVTAASADDPRALPIGKPIDNTTALVLDQQGMPRPAGLFGELWIGGAGLALGYLGDEAQTAAAFRTTAHGRLYKTGDRARWREDGLLEFAGRADTQLKILGHRIEPGEIEEVALRVPGVQQAAVVAAGEEPRRFLALFYAPQIDETLLRRHLEDALPPYMVPTRRIGLTALPLTAGGKIDRRALPTVEMRQERHASAPRRPLTAPEEEILRVWQAVLQHDDIDPDEHFLEAGGDSVKALQVVARLLEAGFRLTVSDLFRLGTVAALAAHAGAAQESAPHTPFAGTLPLSPMQAWFFSPAAKLPRREHYNHALLFVTDPLQPDTARRAALACWRTHDALRATFATAPDGIVTQTILPPLDTDDVFSLVDWRSENAPADRITKDVARRQTEFDLATGPLFRVVLYRVGESDRLLFLAHHLVVDALTWQTVLEDFERAYTQAHSGQSVQLAAPVPDFPAWVREVHASVAQDEPPANTADWTSRLAASDSLLPPAQPGTAAMPVRLVRTLDELLQEELSGLPKHACGASPAETVLTALTLALAGMCPGKRASVWMEGHGRSFPLSGGEALRAAGWFTTVWPVILPVLQPATAATGPDALLTATLAVKEASREAARYGNEYAARRYLGMQAQTLHDLPEPEIVFNYLGDLTLPGGFYRTAPEDVGPETSGQAAALELDVFFRDGVLHLQASVRSDDAAQLFAQTLLEGMAHELPLLLQACAAQTKPLRTASDFTTAPLTQEEFLTLCASRGWSPEAVEDLYPLTPAQEGMLFHLRQDPQTPAYFEQLWFDLEGEVDLPAFEEAWRELSQRHTALRTVFLDSPRGEPLQVVLRDLPPEFRLLDLPAANAASAAGAADSANATAAGDAAVAAIYAEDRARPFDLERGPLVRCTLVRRDERQWSFLHSYPHLIADGWCMGIMLSEFTELYRARKTGTIPQLPDAPAYGGFVESVLHQQKAALAVWRNHLAGFGGRTSIARTTSRSGRRMQEHRFALEPELAASLEKTARNWGVTPGALFQSAWALLLSEHAQSDDVAFGVVTSGRTGGLRGIESMIGLCIQTMPLRARIDRTAPASELARQLQHSRLELEPMAHIPLPQATELSAAELFDHILVFENYPLDASISDELRQTGLQISRPGGHEEVEYDLSIEVHPGLEYRVIFHFNANRYEPALFPVLEEQLRSVLRQQTGNPLARAGEIILPPAPAAPSAWAVPTTPHASAAQTPSTVPAEFLRRAAENPEALCTVCEDGQATRGEIAQRAKAIATALLAEGVQPGEPVALLLGRGKELVPAILGIWLARAVYVPLSPEAPAEHLRGILDDLNQPLLLTTPQLRDERGLANLRTLDAAAVCKNASSATGASASLPEVRPEDTAYIIFTSGSTGKPKGVRVGHHALSNLAGWVVRNLYASGQPQRETWVPPIQFDASLHSLIGTLTGGHTLLIPGDDTRRDPAQLLDFMRRQRSDIVNVTPTFASAILDALGDQPWPGSTVILGAESIAAALLARFYAHPQNSGLTIYNLYGPTEACIEVACHRMTATDWDRQLPVPIGQPVDGAQLRILDRLGRSAPVGVPGEIILCGTCLAEGYHNRPEESARAFVPSPFPGDSARVYRTGDLGRRLPDGGIVFAGRLDRQLKLHGHRIEPGEIEQRLLREPGVTGAAVLALRSHTDASGDDLHLVAFITGRGEHLQQALRKQLPPYMVPETIIALDSFPQNASGKLDERALAAHYAAHSQQATASAASFSPETNEERKLAEIWREVLGASPATREQSFFDAGGNSLSAMRFAGRIRNAWGRELRLRALYESPEFGQILTLLAATAGEATLSSTLLPPSPTPQTPSTPGNEELTPEERALLGLL